MSNRLPLEVNPFRLIDQRRRLTGSVALNDMPRLRELAVGDTDDFSVLLAFDRSDSGRPFIHGRVQGSMALECQRCLEPVSVVLDAQPNVVLTHSQTERRPEEDGYEVYIIEDDRLVLIEFIEDEILLALPVVPRHDNCEPFKPLLEVTDVDRVADYLGKEDKQNPFAVLKDWKKSE